MDEETHAGEAPASVDREKRQPSCERDKGKDQADSHVVLGACDQKRLSQSKRDAEDTKRRRRTLYTSMSSMANSVGLTHDATMMAPVAVAMAEDMESEGEGKRGRGRKGVELDEGKRAGRLGRGVGGGRGARQLGWCCLTRDGCTP